ncbi:MAG: metal ABC transporter permease [Clostridiales bacterium]|nr:metal ABC transporter permease [Clostridiales bacterium]
MDALWGLLSDYTFRTVALGSALLGIISGVLGSFAVLRRQSLLGDGISHAALPGVVLAFALTGSKNTEVLLLGALVTGLAATGLISAIVKHSRVRFDSALGLVMASFVGLGMVLLTWVQRRPDASQAGLSRFLFGQASTLLRRDVVIMAVCGVVLLGVVALFWKELKLLTFDAQFARTVGMPTGALNLLLSLLIVLGIIIGLQTVGVVLMSAMLIAPAVAARQWTAKLGTMALLSALFGAVSGVAGTAASSLVPQLPTGPAIVLCVSGIACVSLLVAPGRGIIYRAWKRSKHRARLEQERREPDGSTV